MDVGRSNRGAAGLAAGDSARFLKGLLEPREDNWGEFWRSIATGALVYIFKSQIDRRQAEGEG